MDDEQEVVDAVLKFVVLALVIGAVVGLVTLVAVKSLGVTGGGSTGGTSGPAASATPSALPTVALSSSAEPSASASSTSEASDSPTPSTGPADGTLTLSASPVQVAPGEHINLAGTYQGRDGIELQVQRKDAGQWGPFASVTVPVRAGSFATYVITSRTGPQRFRVYDAASGKGSNPVTVTVG